MRRGLSHAQTKYGVTFTVYTNIIAIKRLLSTIVSLSATAISIFVIHSWIIGIKTRHVVLVANNYRPTTDPWPKAWLFRLYKTDDNYQIIYLKFYLKYLQTFSLPHNVIIVVISTYNSPLQVTLNLTLCGTICHVRTLYSPIEHYH